MPHNVWTLGGAAPANGMDHEFVIRNFNFVPWQLTIERSGTDVVLTWPTWGGKLQATSSLAGGWTDVPEQPDETAGFLQLRLPVTPGARFFRLAM